jgi:hypothetical protein
MVATARPRMTPFPDHRDAALALAKLAAGAPVPDVTEHVDPTTFPDLWGVAWQAALDARADKKPVPDAIRSALKGQKSLAALLKAISAVDPEEAFVSSSALREGVPEGTINAVVFHSAKEIAEATPEEPEWIVQGFLARGAITELDGPPKRAGKTTWMSLLSRVRKPTATAGWRRG